MTTLVKVIMPSLVSTMSIRQWKELNVVEGSACELFSSHVKVIILHNGSKGVTNYIMGCSAFVAMNTM